MPIVPDFAASFLPRGLLGACSEVYSKLRPPEDVDDHREAVKPGQDHIFTFYNELSDEEKRQLDGDFDTFRVEDFEEAWTNSQSSNDFTGQGIGVDAPRTLNWELKRPPTPTPGANITKVSDVSWRKLSMWRAQGLEMYFKSRVAIVIMSGGKDSHLGEGVPKGVLDIGLLSGKSIFQLYFERILRLQHMVKRKFRRATGIPVYIMCNSENRGIIEEFFHENNFFGVREQDVLFFTQASFPVCDTWGKILLCEKHRIAQEPNGNGGIFRALLEEGMISDMKSRGVTSIYVGSIDNLLGMIGDPRFLGYCEICKAEAGLKCVEKVSPDEKFGIFANKTFSAKDEDIDGDGKVDEVYKTKATVVEFFELPEDLKKRRQKLSSGVAPLSLSCGNISQYFFKVDFIKRMHSSMDRQWHAIPKKVPHINLKTGGPASVPEGAKNAFRLEMFIFDAFEHLKSVVGLEVGRGEFANIKNITGQDSPQSALVAMGRLHQQWIRAAGGHFVDQRIATEREDTKCEISPLVSYAGEDLGGQFPAPINLPFYLPSHQELLQFSAASSAQTRRPSMHYLDWYSEFSQRELEIELNQHLGSAMDMIEDPSTLEYMGERAADEEVLPATPRKSASQSVLQVDSIEDSGMEALGAGPSVTSLNTLGEGSPRRNARGIGKALDDKTSSPGQGAAVDSQQVQSATSGSVPVSAVGSPGAKSKPGLKARDAFWGK